jgi:hypothetical protein
MKIIRLIENGCKNLILIIFFIFEQLNRSKLLNILQI